MAAAELQAVLQAADPWATDLLLSALAAAAASRRRATCTTPFPTSLFQTADGERDYDALLENVQTLPPAGPLAAALDGLSRQQASLLHWLLTHSQRPVGGVRRCTLRAVQEQMPLLTGWMVDVGRNPGLRPHAVLQLSELPRDLVDGSGQRVLAFHGTSMDNIHSILHHGLLNASGTRLERTGEGRRPGRVRQVAAVALALLWWPMGGSQATRRPLDAGWRSWSLPRARQSTPHRSCLPTTHTPCPQATCLARASTSPASPTWPSPSACPPTAGGTARWASACAACWPAACSTSTRWARTTQTWWAGMRLGLLLCTAAPCSGGGQCCSLCL